MITLIAAIIGGLAGGLCVFWYLRRSHLSPPFDQAQAATLPAVGTPLTILPPVGTTVSVKFTCLAEQIHTLSRVEEQKDSNLVLRILVEMGQASLLRLRPGAAAQLEAGTTMFPLEVIQVDFPWVHVRAYPEQAQPAYRQALRLPASFAVRFRTRGARGVWTSGTGVDLSSEGFCFCAPSSSQFSPEQYYETELTINFPHGEKRNSSSRR